MSPRCGGYRLDDGVKARCCAAPSSTSPIIAAIQPATASRRGMEMLGGCDCGSASDSRPVVRCHGTQAWTPLPAEGPPCASPGKSPTPPPWNSCCVRTGFRPRVPMSMGLVGDEVCRPADLMDRAYDYAKRITANGPFAVRKTKESVLRGLSHRHARGLQDRIGALR